MTNLITNKLFADIKINDQAQMHWHVSSREAQLFSIQSPTDDAFAQATNSYGSSALIKALLTRLFTTELPGPGSELMHDDLNYYLPINLHDELTITTQIIEKKLKEQLLIFSIKCINQQSAVICDGKVTVKPSATIITEPVPEHPEIVLFNTAYKFKKLMAQAQAMPNTPRVAVVHPMNTETLKAAIDAATSNLIIPIIIAPMKKLKLIADELKIDLTKYTCIDVPHSHAAAQKAVSMARDGEVDALMKGSLHTDELMHEVVDSVTGIRTDKRISHCFLMDIPTYPRPLTITDAAINIAPDLLDKQGITQNAIDLMHALGIEQPKVAILAAVETVNPKMPATIDAASLCKMADRGQIKGGIIDGPLAFDNAISRTAADIKGIVTPIAGDVDVLVVPNLEAGNMLVKQLAYLTGAVGAGVVLGAKVPIILTSRADPPLARETSCALVKYLVCKTKTAAPL
jgi:phosphate acetyltransferase